MRTHTIEFTEDEIAGLAYILNDFDKKSSTNTDYNAMSILHKLVDKVNMINDTIIENSEASRDDTDWR